MQKQVLIKWEKQKMDKTAPYFEIQRPTKRRRNKVKKPEETKNEPYLIKDTMIDPLHPENGDK